MRMTTKVWAKFESKGKPLHTKQIEGTNREVLLELARWLSEVYMGSFIRVTLARSEIELICATEKRKDVTGDVDMAAELDSMLTSLQGELMDGADRPNPHMPEEE